MRSVLVCLMLIAAVPRVDASIGTEDLVVRAEFRPAQAWVGQRVVLQVDVLAPDAWAQLAKAPRIEVPGAYVLPAQDQGVRLQETIDGQSHSGQRYGFFVYPQRSGRLDLPVTGIEVRVRQLGAEGGEETLPAGLPALTLETRVPPGAEGMEGLISTNDLVVEQRWEPAEGIGRVGDALRRIVRLEAADVSGMAFPPIAESQVDGFGVYPSEPQVDDRSNRGSLRGSRIETVTYVAERAGQFELPAFTYTWWDTGREQLQQVELPGLSVTVVGGGAADSDGHGHAPQWSRFWSGQWWVSAIGVVVLAGLIYRPLLRTWRSLARKRKASEPYRFRQLRDAIRKGRPAPILRALMQWLDLINDSSRPARLDTFLGHYGDPDTRAAVSQLQRQLARDGRDREDRVSDPRALEAGLSRARGRWLARTRPGKAGIFELPPLNGPPPRES